MSFPENKESSRLNILDALRGIAALAVALFHFTNAMPPTLLTSVTQWGWLGVSMFFVISGFIIPYALMKSSYEFPTDYGCFLLKRAARLHPPFLASLVLTILLWHLSALTPGFQGQAPNYTATQVALHAPLLNGVVGMSWIQPVYWTLAIELQYYLTIGLLMPLLSAGRPSFWITVSSLLLSSLLPRVSADSNIWLWPYLPLFVTGILACFFLQKKISRNEFLIGLTFATAIAAKSLSPPEAATGALSALAIAFLHYAWPRRVLWLGAISYSLYLLHVPIGGRIINLTKRVGQESLVMQLICVSGAVALSLLAAAIWFRFLEMPSQRLSSAIKYRSRSRGVPEATSQKNSP
jgi:peptidoglycan/LPS O-acetylase OafA/YrhL